MEIVNQIITILSNYGNIILIVFSVIVSLIAVYNKIKSNFVKCISGFIKDAEKDTSLTNPEKMEMVILWIKQVIPKLFHILFNDKVLEEMAQNIYEDMKKYKDTYIKNKTGLSTGEVFKALETIKDDPKSPVNNVATTEIVEPDDEF